MRDIDAPMTPSEFEDSLIVAKAGGELFDNGATDELLEIFAAIRKDPRNLALIDKARAAFALGGLADERA